ncbi:hypothetical protein K3152_08660 [Qipengyuania sp. 1NDH17]|uniref:Surface-adhesin protein E-like domain-containing protein n=1 Tax=Qipengyuania polymorpha TaxID=2867234 RepID=A0ABS7IXN9_9SPHN|nr:surface-adhesin E family protein [Qipengyuania polymorpha]MBX7458314.1 hypothetical protein [Qipengyuania polymorpha]
MMKFRIALGAALTCLAAPAFAEGRYQFVYIDDDTAVLVDDNSLRKLASSRVRLWAAMIKAESDPDYVLTNFELDCSSRDIRAVHAISYKNEEVANSAPYTNPAQPIAPNSVAEAVANYACDDVLIAGLRRDKVDAEMLGTFKGALQNMAKD